MAMTDAVKLLVKHNVVQGDASGNLMLFEPITRAQMAKVLVTLMGKADGALFLTGATPFPDVAGHWSAGWVAQAKSLRLINGYEDGTFRPDAPVSYAEVAAMLIRAVGREETVTGPWPQGTIDAAARLGVLPTSLSSAVPGQAALRGEVFHMVGLTAFTVPMSGKAETLARTYLDKEPPRITLDAVPAETNRSSLVVSGSVTDAVSVMVNGQTANMDATGRFQAVVGLVAGANAIKVTAEDSVGHQGTATARVTYNAAPRAAQVQVTASAAQTSVSQPVTVTARALDANGNAVSNVTFEWSWDTAAGNFDKATGRFMPVRTGATVIKARTADGLEGTLTLNVTGAPAALKLVPGKTTLVANGRSATALKVQVVDQAGQLVTNQDLDVRLTLSNPAVGLLSAFQGRTAKGEATFVITSAGTDRTGAASVSVLPAPGAPNLNAASTQITFVARQFAGLKLEALPHTFPTGSYTNGDIAVTAVDQDGITMPAPTSYQVTLSSSNPGVAAISKAQATVFAGYTSSRDGKTDGQVLAAGTRGTAVISGTAASGVTVFPVTVKVTDVGATAKLHVREVSPVAADGSTAAQIVVERHDAAGNLVGTDTGPVAISNPPAQVAVRLASDQGGVATFEARSGTPGQYDLTALYTPNASVPAATARATFMSLVAPVSGLHVELVASAPSLAADGVSTSLIRAFLRDDSGGAIVNTGPDIVIALNTIGSAVALLDTQVTIPTGQSYSVSDLGTVQATGVGGVAQVVGTVTAGNTGLQVKAVAIAVVSTVPGLPYIPPSGGGAVGTYPIYGSGRMLVVPGIAQPKAGTASTWTILVQDVNGNLLTTDQYALMVQVQVNGVTQTTMPQGMTLAQQGTGINPLTQAVKSAAGSVTLNMTYNKTGTVTVVPVQATLSDGSKSTVGFVSNSGQVTYVANDPAKVMAEIIPNLGDKKAGYVSPTAYGDSARINVTVADQYDNPVPTVFNVTVNRQGGGAGASAFLNGTATATAPTGNGVAYFVLSPLGGATGTDTYAVQATAGCAGCTYNDQVTLTVRTGTTLAKPVIRWVQGSPSGGSGSVTTADDKVIFRLGPVAVNPVLVRVYSNFTQIYDGGATTAGGSDFNFEMPRSALTTYGTHSLRIKVSDGVNWSDYSDPVNLNYIATGSITGAFYDAATNRLTITYTSNTVDTAGTFDASKLSIGGRQLTGAAGYPAASATQTVFTLLDADANMIENQAMVPTANAALYAYDGWNRTVAGANTPGTTGTPIRPWAVVNSASYSTSTKTLTLIGSGFTTGSVVPGYVTVKTSGCAAVDCRLTVAGTATVDSDTQARIVMTNGNDLEAKSWFSQNLAVDLGLGWFANAGNLNRPVGDISLSKPTVPVLSSAYYDAAYHRLTLVGTNLLVTGNSASISVTGLTVRDLNGGSRPLASGSTVYSPSNSQVVIQLHQDDWSVIENAANFAGDDVKLEAAVGWNRDSAGGYAAAATVPLTAFGRVDSASYDAATNTLTLIGTGLNTGTLRPAYVVIRDPSKPTTLRLAGGTVTATNAQATIVLTAADAANLEDANLFDGTDATIAFDRGWLVSGASAESPPSAQINLSK